MSVYTLAKKRVRIVAYFYDRNSRKRSAQTANASVKLPKTLSGFLFTFVCFQFYFLPFFVLARCFASFVLFANIFF